MKIEFGATTLGDDSTGDHIVLDQWSHARAIQTDQIAFSDEAADKSEFTKARGNIRNQTSFVVQKSHADPKTAQRFVRTHGDGLSGQANLIFTQDSQVDTLQNAALVSVLLQIIDGKETVLRYTFTGGIVTTS